MLTHRIGRLLIIVLALATMAILPGVVLGEQSQSLDGVAEIEWTGNYSVLPDAITSGKTGDDLPCLPDGSECGPSEGEPVARDDEPTFAP